MFCFCGLKLKFIFRHIAFMHLCIGMYLCKDVCTYICNKSLRVKPAILCCFCFLLEKFKTLIKYATFKMEWWNVCMGLHVHIKNMKRAVEEKFAVAKRNNNNNKKSMMALLCTFHWCHIELSRIKVWKTISLLLTHS